MGLHCKGEGAVGLFIVGSPARSREAGGEKILKEARDTIQISWPRLNA